MSAVSEKAPSPIESVAESLESYARRGVFRGFSRGPARHGKITFKMMWHRDRLFEVEFDSNKNTLRFPLVLPNVPARSSMYKEFKEFLKSRQADELPEHRRIDKSRAQIKPFNRGGSVSLTLKFEKDEHEYGTSKIINLVHEIYMVFLYDGRYLDYMIENFDLDPDSI